MPIGNSPPDARRPPDLDLIKQAEQVQTPAAAQGLRAVLA